MPATCTDEDGDGYGAQGASACPHANAPFDCDDDNALVHPQAAEACDGVDNDCNGAADQGCAGTCVGDADCDGVTDGDDNCPSVSNASQADSDDEELGAATAAWRFEETSGTTAEDSAGSHTATLHDGASFTAAGRFGGAVVLDGVNDYLSTPDSADFAFGSGDFTLELWANLDQIRSGTRYQLPNVLIAQDEGGGNTRKWVWYLGEGQILFHLHDPSTGGDFFELGAASLPLGSYHHLSLVRRGTHLEMYVDGALTGSAQTTRAMPNVVGALTVGQAEGLGHLDGLVDEVAIYRRALAASEVRAHAEHGLYSDGIGNSCDGCPQHADPSCVPTTCTDADNDGYGTLGATACTGGPTHIDCDDANAGKHPGADEACDGVDNDCNAIPDEGCAPELTVTYEYGDPGDPRWTAIEGPTFGRVERSFSASGRLSSWKGPNGDEFTRHYDATGRVEEELDALGNRTVYGYDAAGRLETITDETLDATTTFERDSAGRVTRTLDALQNETVTAYKLGGRLLSTRNARGFTTSFERTPVQSSITDALTRTTATSLTAFGLPTSTSYPGGASTGSAYLGTTRLDSSQSYPTSLQDELERSRTFDYDTRSGLSSAADLSGESWQYAYTASPGSAVSYDVFSGEVSVGQHDGGARAYSHSGGGTEYRDVSTVTGDGGSEFAHLLSEVRSPRGEVTRFVRGTSGRIEHVQYPDGGIKRITYGPDVRPQQVTLPQGTVLNFEHDDAGRELSRASSIGESRSFTYGPGDRIETMTDDTGTTTYHYDGSGRFTGLTYPHGGSVRYDRDVLDRVTAVRVKATASAAEVVTSYDYDENGNLEEITDPLSGVTTFEYDQVDRLTERTLPNGVTTTYGYDDRDRVLSVVHRGPMNNVLASVTYVRSASGEPTRITREDDSYVVLTYDDALRVDTETYYDDDDNVLDAVDYDYDADGNRVAKDSLSGGYESYAYEPGFRLTTITATAGSESYGYDGGGRLTAFERGGVESTLEYNSDDKVTRVLEGASEVVAYTYDGAGRRVGGVEGGVQRRYLVAPNLGDGFETPQAVTDASGDVLASYVFAGEQPMMRIVGGQAVYYLQDGMGSVIGMADGSGASTAMLKYDAFGNVTSSSGASAAIPSSIGTDFRYHGMQLDATSGLYHVRARTYDARTGRFASRDPVAGIIHRPESMNPYVFCNSNAEVWRDPTGLFTSEWQVAMEMQRVLSTISQGVASVLQFFIGRRLTSSETGRFSAEFGTSINLGEVRLKKLAQPDARARYLFDGIVLVDTDEFEGGVQSGALRNYGVLAHELLHMWQFQNRPILRVWSEVVEAKFDPNAYDLPFDRMFNRDDPSLVLRSFVAAPAEQQAEIFAACFGLNTPDCDMVRAYVQEPSVARYESLVQGRGVR